MSDDEYEIQHEIALMPKVNDRILDLGNELLRVLGGHIGPMAQAARKVGIATSKEACLTNWMARHMELILGAFASMNGHPPSGDEEARSARCDAGAQLAVSIVLLAGQLRDEHPAFMSFHRAALTDPTIREMVGHDRMAHMAHQHEVAIAN